MAERTEEEKEVQIIGLLSVLGYKATAFQFHKESGCFGYYISYGKEFRVLPTLDEALKAGFEMQLRSWSTELEIPVEGQGYETHLVFPDTDYTCEEDKESQSTDISQ